MDSKVCRYSPLMPTDVRDGLYRVGKGSRKNMILQHGDGIAE